MTGVALSWIVILVATLVILTRWKKVFEARDISLFLPFSVRMFLTNDPVNNHSQFKKMNAQLEGPSSIFLSNGELFICDSYNHRIRKVLRNGSIVTICGTQEMGYNGDGQPATLSQLNLPKNVVVSSSNQVYISDSVNHRIRKILCDGTIVTIAGTGERSFKYDGEGQPAVNAKLCNPQGLFVTDDEEILFCDTGASRVRKIDRNGILWTIVGNGQKGLNGIKQAKEMRLDDPTSVFMYKKEIYITDSNNNRILKILQNGNVIRLAGNRNDRDNVEGLSVPKSVFVHKDEIYFSDRGNHQIKKIRANGTIATIAGIGEGGYSGDGGLAIHAQLCHPAGLFVDHLDQVYVADSYNSRIRKIDSDGIITTIVGSTGGYAGDVLFEFEKYPHIGPKKRLGIESKAFYDIIIATTLDDRH